MKKFQILGILISSVMLISCGSENESINTSQTNLQQEFLPVEKAFVFSANAESNQILRTHWVIAEGYHLYKDKFKFSISPDHVEIINVDYPPAEMFSDKNLGNLESYKDSVEITLKIKGSPVSNTVSLTATYQGCADVGLCYPPETRVTEFTLASL